MKVCSRCKIEDGSFASIHEHHKNGNHFDNRPENKIFLCANCHTTLHWKRWHLSDIGLDNVEIIYTKKPKPYVEPFNKIYDLAGLLKNNEELLKENEKLKQKYEHLHKKLDDRIWHLTALLNRAADLTGYISYSTEELLKEYISKYFYADISPSKDDLRQFMKGKCLI